MEAPLVKVNDVFLCRHLFDDLLVEILEEAELGTDLIHRYLPINLLGLVDTLYIFQDVLAVFVNVHTEDLETLTHC